KTTQYWVDTLNKADVPSGAILSLEDALRQPQIKHRETLQTIACEGVGELPLFNLTALFDKAETKVTSPPPRLSEHTEDILRGLGYSNDEIGELGDKGVIQKPK